MTVFDLGFSFDAERETDSYYIVYPTLKEATKAARQQLTRKRDDDLADAEKYGVEPSEEEYTATLSRITVVPLTREAFCKVINSGEGWRRTEEKVGIFTLGKRYTYKKL